MSVYSTSLRTQLIDPQFHSQDRCEFRLDNRGQSYMPTMRIGNLGLKKSANHTNLYSAGPGGLGVISRIRLMDGNEELDSLRNVGQWMTFKNALKTNSQNTSVFNQLDGNRQGQVYGAPTGFLQNAAPKRVREGQADTLTTLDLRECFPFLNSVSHLSTKLFKNLRVVIEYVSNSKPAQMVENIGGTHIDGLAKVLPLLIVDEIEDDALVATLDRQMTSASWVSVMHDQANLPAVGEATAYGSSKAQRVQMRINGFLNKTVSRMMIAKTYENPLHDLKGSIVRQLGGNGSKALFKEAINMRVNGGNIVAGNGLDSPAQIQGMLSDTWGSITTTPFANQQSVGVDDSYVAVGPLNVIGITPTDPSVLTTATVAAGVAGGPEQGFAISNSSWIGLPIHARVSDMSFDIARTGTYSEGTSSSRGNSQALNIHFFAEVARGMTVSDGEYKIFDA